MQEVKQANAHILMCGDAGYFQHIAACLVSLLESNKGIQFSVVVAATRSSEESNRKLQGSLRRYKNIDLRVVHFDPSCLAGLPLTTAYPSEIYVRFWVEHYFAEDVDRVIYLDGDTVITGSIEPLLALDMGENVLAAVQIPGSDRPQRFGYDPKFGYFNSGVMVLNLPQWRAINAKELLVTKAYSMTGKLNDPDQDVLNICFHDRYVRLDYVWNAISPFFKEMNHLALTKTEIARVVRDVRIVHFNGGAKPWHYLCFHPYAKEYLHCVSKTEWRGFRPSDYSAINIIKKKIISVLGERRSGMVSSVVRKFLATAP
ncbi:glycosyltransferase family 8 protein [Noviherbaspirillum suwonense]|uniref:Lipopolysaccharide biosynthesis protein, LPS:glycosyltransferase n=1 Tax=Noviherbaspirillum suwonense TaxID=1224511 RepID=A0ABY1QXD4_9BURK|nr:glycosyltransferase family 8 protein [Noviherbaspirillum suwonense]SMP82001.1 Lipopolysaccharide biosynthesis protein, LPS:glycosyltransferase [Noviherbaspirillum suwonense]